MFLADVVFHNDRFPLNVFLLWNRYPKCVTCDTFQYLSSPYFEITVFLLAALLERTSSMTPPREPTRSDASDSAPFPFGNKSKELIGTIVLLETSKINGMQDNSSDGCCHMLAGWVNREARGRQLWSVWRKEGGTVSAFGSSLPHFFNSRLKFKEDSFCLVKGFNPRCDWFLGLFYLDRKSAGLNRNRGSLTKNCFTLFLQIIVGRSKEQCNTI